MFIWALLKLHNAMAKDIFLAINYIAQGPWEIYIWCFSTLWDSKNYQIDFGHYWIPQPGMGKRTSVQATLL